MLRTEAGGPYGTAYHAHIKTSDGTLQGRAREHGLQRHGGPGRPGGRGGTATATTAAGPGARRDRADRRHQGKVEAAVKAEYAGATIERTETNGDSAAPYESHITTSAGKELEVLVSKDFKVSTRASTPRARRRGRQGPPASRRRASIPSRIRSSPNANSAA